MKNKIKKEIILYSIITIILIFISILNNLFWKIGKEENATNSINDTISNQQLVVNNITYDIPYEEQWLD